MENAQLIFGLWIAVLLLAVVHGEEVKKLEDAMKKLKDDTQSRKSILAAVEKLSAHYKKQIDAKPVQTDGEDTQYMIASPLTLVEIRDKFTFKVDETVSEFYRNKQFRVIESKDCDATCKKSLNSIMTKINYNEEVDKETKVHTELQFMYGVSGRSLLEKNPSKIILIYSNFIPCSQLQSKTVSYATSFGECSADLGNFLTEKRKTTPYYFVVVYNTNTNSDLTTSELYMSLGGIASFTLDSAKTNLVQSGVAKELSLDYTKSLSLPNNYHRFPRIPSQIRKTLTEIQVLNECLSRNFVSSELDGSASKVYQDPVNQASSYNLERQFYQFTRPFDTKNLETQEQKDANIYSQYEEKYKEFLEGNNKALEILELCKIYKSIYHNKGRPIGGFKKRYENALPNWYKPRSDKDPEPQEPQVVSCPDNVNKEQDEFFHKKATSFWKKDKYPTFWEKAGYFKEQSEAYFKVLEPLTKC